MIYVVGVPESVGLPVKVGTSENVGQRLLGLQRGESMPLKVAKLIRHAEALDVLATYPGDQKLESRLHALLRDRHLDGEWFMLGTPTSAVERVDAAVERAGREFVQPAIDVALDISKPRRPRTRAVPVAIHPSPPTADEASREFDRFRAWMAAGFTEDQALRLLAELLRRP